MASNILNGCFGVNLSVTILCVALAAPCAAKPKPKAAKAAKPEVSLESRLLEAFQRHDPVELERAARRLGIGGLRAALGSARSARVAALAAAPLVPRGFLLLRDLIPLCADHDRATALAAAEATHQIAEDLRQPELQLNDELPETLSPLAKQLGKLAGDRQISVDVRVKCLQALAQLLELCTIPVEPLLALLAEPEAAVRRSATEVFAHAGEAARARLAKLVASDSASGVARAAAAVLCAEVPLKAKKPSPELEALKEAGALDRLRELTSDADAATDELLDVARCLTRSGTPADKKALKSLQSRSPALRRQLSHLD
jgi:hypothetical protein